MPHSTPPLPAITVQVAEPHHARFASHISDLLEESARARKTGIAKRSPDYIRGKIEEGKAIIALTADDTLAGFCYIETWSHGEYVANSGLIVIPDFRGLHLGWKIKRAAFELSRRKYPRARIFSITTSPAVMKMNTDLGFRPVPFSELTDDPEFWEGCRTCVNHDILTRNNHQNCLCTGLIFRPDSGTGSAEALRQRPVLLPFSGDLASTYCAWHLTRREQRPVTAVTVQTGGYSDRDLERIARRAGDLGIPHHVVLNISDRVFSHILHPLLLGGRLTTRESEAIRRTARHFEIQALARYAEEVLASAIAHPTTSDEGRDGFEQALAIRLPGTVRLAPLRDGSITPALARERLASEGLWPDDAVADQWDAWADGPGVDPHPGSPDRTSIRFTSGIVTAVDDLDFADPWRAVRHLDALCRAAAAAGTRNGALDGWPLAAGDLIDMARSALATRLLSRWQRHWMDHLGGWFATYLKDGDLDDPVVADIATFLAEGQGAVSGIVIVSLAGGRVEVQQVQPISEEGLS